MVDARRGVECVYKYFVIIFTLAVERSGKTGVLNQKSMDS